MKKFLDTLLIIMIILTGLSLFLYPTVSNYLSEQNGSQAIDGYTENVSVLDEGASAEELAKAERYNAALYRSSIDAEPTAVSQSDYDYMLNISGDGMIGYLDIPRISVRLPIYHGTDGKKRWKATSAICRRVRSPSAAKAPTVFSPDTPECRTQSCSPI